MISVDEALRLVLEQAGPLPSAGVTYRDSLGLVLDEVVASDVNSPPHDKSIVDGYALVAADNDERTVLEEVAAGQIPHRAVTPGFATHVMTGAPIPEGADAVVMVERTERVGSDKIRICDPTLSAGQNIMPLGASMTKGQVVLDRGRIIRPLEIGLLAEVGHTQVQVIPHPRVAVLATGSELVEGKSLPEAGRLRNSNGPMLSASARNMNAEVIDLGVARDDRKALSDKVAAGLDADILVTSGGVSAGVYDFVPQVFESLGVEKVFHKVSLKPGKPLWFGVHRGSGRSDSSGRPTLVFGLPGNPVSSYVCFELFVRAAINKLAAREAGGLPRITAQLAAGRHVSGYRTTYYPARIVRDLECAKKGLPPIVETVRWRGSGDLSAMATANALAIFPEGDHHLAKGDLVEALLL